MALAAIRALYDYDEENQDSKRAPAPMSAEDEAMDRLAVFNDPAFSVMSKIKLNLTPVIATRVRSVLRKACPFHRL